MLKGVIGLIDKELKALRPYIPACEQTVFDCASCSGGCLGVAKAQLKKVVDKGDTTEVAGGYSVYLFISDEEMQSLLEEVKE